MAQIEVTVWTLEQLKPAQLRPAAPPKVPVELVEVEHPLPEFNRFLYTAVGGDWHWTERLRWTYAQWSEWVDRPEQRTLVAASSGAPAGYAELESQADGNVEIAYFGLLPSFTGQGVGGWLLEQALRAAWASPGTERVWVHTCSLDGPAALANYQARGMQISNVRVELQEVSDQPPGQWPGANRQP